MPRAARTSAAANHGSPSIWTTRRVIPLKSKVLTSGSPFGSTSEGRGDGTDVEYVTWSAIATPLSANAATRNLNADEKGVTQMSPPPPERAFKMSLHPPT